MDQVSSSSRVCVVGMYGVGGIGKTTICKALCNELSSRFHDNVCHVEIGHRSEMKLLRKALKRLTTLSHEILDKLDDVEEVTSIPWYFLLMKMQCLMVCKSL
jgi:Ni2+-binding GTPase involved in maturation of urease and hydrogenase